MSKLQEENLSKRCGISVFERLKQGELEASPGYMVSSGPA